MSESKTSAQDVLALAVLVVIISALYFFTIRPGHDWGGDFSVYLMEARNIALGRSYNFTGYVPDATSSIYMPAAYPPLFPALLAPLYAVFGMDYFAFKLLVEVLVLASLVLFYVLARWYGLNPLAAFLAVFAFGLSSLVLAVKESVISDGPYLFFASLALVIITLVYKRGWDKSRPVVSAFIVALAILCAYMTRAAGLSIALAFGAYDLLRARRLRLFPVWTGIFFAVGAAVCAAAFFDSRTYGSQFTWTPATYLLNARFYLRSPTSLWAGMPAIPRAAMALASIGLALVCLAKRSATQWSILEPYFFFSLAPALVYSSGRSDRYILPLYPIFFIYIVQGFEWLSSRFVPSMGMRRGVYAAGAALLLAGAFADAAHADRGPYTEGVEKPSFAALSNFVSHTGNPADLFLFWNPRVLTLYTERRSAWYPHTQSDMEFDRETARKHAAYVIVYRQQPDDVQQLLPHLTAHPNEYRRVYDDADYAVYRVCIGASALSCQAAAGVGASGSSTSNTENIPALPR